MGLSLPQVLLSILIFLVLFFSIGFILNMLLRMSWIMAIIYPIVCIAIIDDDLRLIDYFRDLSGSINFLIEKSASLHMADITILISGFVGAILSGVVIKMLRKNGYQMF
ncbi:YuiB family protein [Bacillus carboniphilus]|uniref:YuiB family protein n=1 Tax=Bacillus carboniphilus TaxID=86663 RepID=UPI00353251B2